MHKKDLTGLCKPNIKENKNAGYILKYHAHKTVFRLTWA